MSAAVETHEFQAEARELLDIVIHSLYSNKDIFLRELISNASDALDRLRFEAVARPELIPPGTELHIRVSADEKTRTLTIADNGIGMSPDEVKSLIGTIARSGARQFMQEIKQARTAESPHLIGQFGVGFYSAFMVADKVSLVTRKAGETIATKWESTGQGTYTLEQIEKPEQGTEVTLHLKPADSEDALHDYVQEWKIKEIIKHYSDFVAYPIKMVVSRREMPRDAEGKPIAGESEKEIHEDQTLNSMKAIWLRDKEEVSDEDYKEFYKHIAHDWNEPLAWTRAKIEGTLEYRILLYIPSAAPFDMYLREGRRGVQLYVKRVFIMDNCEALLPIYLRFVRGVVDSEDLSLNISREMLQQNRLIQRMQKGVVAKAFSLLEDLRDNKHEDYLKFWKEFGPVFKEGAYIDRENQQHVLNLMLFQSTAGDDLVTLKDYVGRMKEGQDAIYYMTGESRLAVENSPHLEAFREKNYEVLILTDPVDEVWPFSVNEYAGKRIRSAGRGAVDLGTDEERQEARDARQTQQEAHKTLLEFLKNKLADHVKDVRLSSRLTSSPVCLVTEEGDISIQMEQLLRAANQEAPRTKRILEINPKHPILDTLQTMYEKDKANSRLADFADLLYGQALLVEGSQPPDPARFSRLVADLMVQSG